MIISGCPAQGRRPYVEFLGVRYSNARLAAATAQQIGVSVVARVNIDDLRSFEIFIEGRGSLGHVSAQGLWFAHKHDIQARREILRKLRSQTIKARGISDSYFEHLLRSSFATRRTVRISMAKRKDGKAQLHDPTASVA